MNPRQSTIAAAVILLICTAVAVWFAWPKPKYDFDQLGGTILVYEIAPTEEDREGPNLAKFTAESLQRRLDPENRNAAVVTPVGENRVEIKLAKTTANHADDVARAKSMIAKIGRLEFRILANATDDAEAIEHAKKMLNDAGLAKDLQDAQERGAPPPALWRADKFEPQVFTIKVGPHTSLVTYGWVELGPHERRAYNLDNDAEKDPARNAAWLKAKENRGRATTLNFADAGPERPMLHGALFYSRECKARHLTEDERRKKAVEYFVLARDPELDAKKPEKEGVGARRTRPVDGSFLLNALVSEEAGRPAVSFALNQEGTELFRTLTRKNVPTGDGPDEMKVKRHLAIIFDGQVLSAPTINSEVGGQGQITGSFTKEEVQSMVDILRGGALPAGLKSQPVSESTVASKQGK